MEEKIIFVSKKYANDLNSKKYNIVSGYFFRDNKKHDVVIGKPDAKEILDRVTIAKIICDTIIDDSPVIFNWYGNQETWHFKII